MKYFLSLNNRTIFSRHDDGSIYVCCGSKDFWLFTGMSDLYLKGMTEITEAESRRFIMAQELLK